MDLSLVRQGLQALQASGWIQLVEAFAMDNAYACLPPIHALANDQFECDTLRVAVSKKSSSSYGGGKSSGGGGGDGGSRSRGGGGGGGHQQRYAADGAGRAGGQRWMRAESISDRDEG